MKTILATFTLLLSFNAYSQTGTESCLMKKSYLRDICKQQDLKGDIASFSQCANGFSYEISTNKQTIDTSLMHSQVSCKVVEIRKVDGINKRTAYYDDFNNKAIVYEHQNGLSYSYVYGKNRILSYHRTGVGGFNL